MAAWLRGGDAAERNNNGNRDFLFNFFTNMHECEEVVLLLGI
jgi:hypothetical protein